MKITVKLVGAFCVGRFKKNVQEYPSGIKVVEVIDHLQLPKNVLGIILINGLHAGEQDVLEDGDTLSLLPLLDGG
ncbi:MoaD/ThiS family protein [Deltaproteobacteria bacterium IMCC39524]|nr:MoaD/ThiS family protein [Deltaproteobacteria bacterium IMCC39524]